MSERLTAEQQRTIAGLRKAIARCGKAGVALYGVDATILAIRAEVLNGVPITDIASEKQDFFEVVVEGGGVYIDSGGW